MDKQPAPTIRDLYPHYTEKELAEAEDNLERYLTLVLRIFERLELQKAKQLTDNAVIYYVNCQLLIRRNSPQSGHN